MVSAWFMANDERQDQRLRHELVPPRIVPINVLKDMGVDYWYFDPELYRFDPLYSGLIRQRGYTYQDEVELSPSLTENYEQKIRQFYDEHLHADDEIRFVLAGSGYFDVRDFQDRWIRIEVTRGDMICLPAGIFHRFTTDTKNYIKAMRLFIGDPIWTPHSRTLMGVNIHPAALAYRHKYSPTLRALEAILPSQPVPRRIER